MRWTMGVMALGALVMGGSAMGEEGGSKQTATETGFLHRTFKDDGGEHKYVLFVPRAYASEKKWPVILFLHGAGERGNDGKKLLKEGLAEAIKAREATFPFIAILPQCEDAKGYAKFGWYGDRPDGKRALAILSLVEKEYATDPDRIYLTGLSMGGFGTWHMASMDPGRWAAIAPICGGGDIAWAPKLAPLPIWCFHGDKDLAVPVGLSRSMIEAIKKAGGAPKYTEYPGVGHNSWDKAYDTDELYTWLLEHRRAKK